MQFSNMTLIAILKGKQMYKIVFFVPVKAAQKVMNACFDAGAGKIGNYDRCCFYSAGVGQFRPLEGSDPHLGKLNNLEKVKELRVEMVCLDHKIRDVIHALKESHPYETPAYEVTQLLDF